MKSSSLAKGVRGEEKWEIELSAFCMPVWGVTFVSSSRIQVYLDVIRTENGKRYNELVDQMFCL